MTHLSPDTLVDLLDGTRAETAVLHLASCAACRQQLADLRVSWQAAADVEVPEPSPLFWDHLSARVRAAVAAEVPPRAPWWRIDWSWTSVGLAGAVVAALVLVAFLQVSRPFTSAVGTPETAGVGTVAAIATAESLTPLPDDESMLFVADLASHLDWDGVAELGLTTEGLSDRGASEMTADERIELQRLLRAELGPGHAADL